MKNLIHFTQTTFLLLALLAWIPSLAGQEKRAMTIEDVMNFHHMQSPVINSDGSNVAYSVSPDRGDGYGVLVSSGGNELLRVERAVNPRFSADGNWLLFTQKPPLSESEGKPASEKPNDGAVLIDTSDGSKTVFTDVKRSSFSTVDRLLFVHHHTAEDTTLADEQNEKLKKAGTTLLIKNMRNDLQESVPFVDSWTVDSLATTLVFTIKDTLESNNGLWYMSLRDISSSPVVIDTTGNRRFGSFSWHEKSSTLAYMRADNADKDTVETAGLFIWNQKMAAGELLAGQDDASQGYFLPFDNRLAWNNDASRLFFGFRPERFAAKPDNNNKYESVIDSIRQNADIDIWHGEDPLIKTHEKATWNQASRQNLISVLDMDERKIIRLADEEVTDVQPALNGDFVIATTNVPYSKRITWEGRFRDVYAINLLTGERILVAEEISDMAGISPNGKFILWFEDDHWHTYETETGIKKNLSRKLDVVFFDETNDTPSTPSSYRIAGWMDDGESVLIYDRYDIWHAALRSGNMRNITGGEGRKNEITFRVRKLDDEPLFGAREQLWLEGFNEKNKQRAIYSCRINRQGVTPVMDENRNLSLRMLSGDKSTIVYSRESYDEFPDLWLTDTRFKDPVRLSFLGNQLEQFNWGTAELVSFNSADGVPLQGVVIKPGDYDPSKKYPVFVYYYEKFSQRLHDFNQTVINHRPSFGYYASNGYVVYLPDIHFKEGRPGMSAVNSLVPAVKKLIETGIADPEAIGLHGHSWSGYQTAYVVTQTDIFKAAIAGAPVSNMTSAYGGIRWGSGLARQFQYEQGQSRLGSSLFERRYLYIENSPLFYAHEINTPLLIMHGDVDEAVPWEQSIELYLAMRRAGKDIIFLQYRDEPHHPQKYQNKLDYTIRMKEYFDYHLRGYGPARWITDGVPYSDR